MCIFRKFRLKVDLPTEDKINLFISNKNMGNKLVNPYLNMHFKLC